MHIAPPAECSQRRLDKPQTHQVLPCPTLLSTTQPSPSWNTSLGVAAEKLTYRSRYCYLLESRLFGWVGDRVGPYIDDRCSWLDPAALDNSWLPAGCNYDVCLTHDRLHILQAAVAQPHLSAGTLCPVEAGRFACARISLRLFTSLPASVTIPC